MLAVTLVISVEVRESTTWAGNYGMAAWAGNCGCSIITAWADVDCG